MARFSLILLLLALTIHAADPLYSRVSLTVSGETRSTVLSAMAVVSNKIERANFQLDVPQSDGLFETNGSTYSASWFVTFNATNIGWKLWRFAAVTNTVAGGLSYSINYHVCPCGNPTNPPAWGPCTEARASFVSTNR